MPESFGRIPLFSIKYGRFDGEIDLFSMEEVTLPQASIFMSNGIFYIGAAASKKVLQFSSYGDLLSVYYNPEANPKPNFGESVSYNSFSRGEGSSGAMVQRAVEYPFNSISAVAVDSNRRLFVADTLPLERAEYSEEEGLMFENIVIRFDASGTLIDYLGQEGPGGTPFSAIAGIYVNLSDELFVVTLKQNGAEVFWFNSSGMLLYRIPVIVESLPSPYTEGEKRISVLSSVIPSRRGGVLYFKIDYYAEETDAETGVQSGIAFEKSVIYPFFIEDPSFGSFTELPSFEIEEGAPQSATVKIPYSMIGVTEDNRIFLYAPTQEGYAICIAELHSRRIERVSLEVSIQEKLFNAFHLSSEGILSALLASADEAYVVWWRMDSL